MKPIVIVLLALSLAGCNRNQEEEPADETAVTSRTGTKQTARAPVYPEAEALGVLNALHDGELALVRVARDVSQNEEVLRFAAVLMADHNGLGQVVNAAVAKAGESPSENAAATRIRSEGDSVARALSGITMGFNNTWAEEQVKAHERMLAVVDSAIIPSVANKDLKTLLEQARPTMVAHLQRAMQILAMRRKQATERGETWVSGIQVATQASQAAGAPRPPRDTTSQPAPTPPVPDTTQAPPTSTSNM